MSWILDHFQIIIAVAGVIAYYLNQRAREKAGEAADYDEDGLPENRPRQSQDSRPASPVRGAAEMDQEERARRIREEIRRKIAERRGAAPAPATQPAPLPRFDPFRPVFQEQTRAAPPPLRPPEPSSPREAVAVHDDSAALERQRRLAEQLAELEEKRREARRFATQTRSCETASSGSPVAASPALGARGVAAELRDPRALRRAFVLREVLSAPVALR